MDVSDMDAFQAVMESEANAEAMKYDGVRQAMLVVRRMGLDQGAEGPVRDVERALERKPA